MRRARLLPLLALLLPAALGAQTLKGELTASLDDAERKFVALAESMPEERYGWRPAPGVRSIGEVYMHVVGANLMIPRFAGVTLAPPVQLSRDAETAVTDKATIVRLLHQAFGHAKAAVASVPDDAMDTPVDLFGQKSTYRGVLLLLTTHAHEHLGQSIAYARTVGVLPPWSAGGDR